MYNTKDYKVAANYSTNPAGWPDYMPYVIWVATREFDWNREFSCSDSLAEEINRAIEETGNLENCTSYENVDDFLNSLRNR